MKKQHNEDNIQALSAREAVRLRPAMYFDKCFTQKNIDSLPLELACHAIDEVFDNNCTSIVFSLFEDYFSIKYDAGMSLDKKHNQYCAELIMTSLFACRNEKKHLSVGEEFCELGIATINFASEYCELTTVFNGNKGTFRFTKGELLKSDVQPTQIENNSTEIVLKPDPLIFNNLTFSEEGVKTKIDKLCERLVNVDITLNVKCH